MKISNSKKQLAKIISENGGWRDGAEFASQGRKTGAVVFVRARPRRCRDVWQTLESALVEVIHPDVLIHNWHQTILSRDEYFHLYPAPGATAEEPEHVWTNPPTIEQLAADYRNRRDYAGRKQQEADAAKAEAEAKLAELVAAGKAVGLVLSVAAPEPELMITDWRDLQLGDIIEYVNGDIEDKIGMTGPVVEFAENASDGMFVRLRCDTGPNKGRLGWPREWRFIRRPAKEDNHA